MSVGLVQGINNPARYQQPVNYTTGSVVAVAGKCYARYLGISPIPMSSIQLYFYASSTVAVAGGGGVSLNWAELGIATSAVNTDFFQTNISLTNLGFVSVDTEVKAAATIVYRKTITANIPAGVPLWILFSSSYQTTQASFRFPSTEEVRGYGRSAVTTQPSLVIGTPVTFVGTPGTGFTVPWLEADF